MTHLSAAGGIDFAVTTEARIDDGIVADFRLKSARRLAENAAVLRAQMAPGVRVLNIDTDLGEQGEA